MAGTLHSDGTTLRLHVRLSAVEPHFSVNRCLATYPMTDERQKERQAQSLLTVGL